MNIAQGILPFQLIEDSSNVLMTSFSGLPMVMETFRALGLPQSIAKHLPFRKRPGKYEEADYVESFLPLCADQRSQFRLFFTLSNHSNLVLQGGTHGL